MEKHRNPALGRVAAVTIVVLACLASPICSAQQVTIASDTFSNVFLRLDGQAITSFQPNGGGTVNGQFGAFAWERFCIRPQTNGTVAFESVAFPGRFLRLDGRGVTDFLPPGGGVVNVQFGAFAWEQFWPRRQFGGPDKFTFESAAFPNVFLRLDGTGVTHFLGSGGGTLNAQFAAYAWEHFTRVTVFPSTC